MDGNQPIQKRNRVPRTWDTLYATYWWRIYLKPEFSFGATLLTGYSKMCEQSESQDKAMLLRRKIVSLYQNGYLFKSTLIEFYMRKDFVINKDSDYKILTLSGENYNINEDLHSMVFKTHGEFLKSFYYEIKKPNPDIEKILPRSRTFVSKDDFLNVQKCHFQNEAQMYAYASRLINHGHAPGAVNNFINQYKQLKNWK